MEKTFINIAIKNLLNTVHGIVIDPIVLEKRVNNALNLAENWAIIEDLVIRELIPYKLNRCTNCSNIIKGDWKYCAYCGRQIK